MEVKFCEAFYNTKNGKIKPAISGRRKICLCKKPDNPDLPCIQCDKCKLWIHKTCTGLG